MKKIEAIIRPYKLDDVQERLSEVGVDAMTVTEVRGYGRGGGRAPIYPGAEYIIDFVPKLKLEVVVPDDLLEDAIDAVVQAAKTGEHGDGKLFIYQVEDAVRVRSSERGPGALM